MKEVSKKDATFYFEVVERVVYIGTSEKTAQPYSKGCRHTTLKGALYRWYMGYYNGQDKPRFFIKK